MESFRRTIHGLDLQFIPEILFDRHIYYIKEDNHHFIMSLDEAGDWKIRTPVPIWIMDLEEELSLLLKSFSD